VATKINTRSPFYIKAQDTDLASATLTLYIATGDFTQIGTSDLKYTINKTEISGNNYVVFEISELIRDYLDIEFDGNYNDQAVWIRYEFDVINSAGTTLFSEADLLLGVDGYTYFEQGANVQDNLLPDTNKLNSWTKSNITVSENNDTGIFDGFNDATELQATTSGNSFVSKGFTETGKLTYSVYAKTSGKDFIVLRAPDVSNNNYAFFNISNGTIGTVLGDDILDARISTYNDYYKCEIDLDIDEAAQKTAYIYLADADNNFNSSTSGTAFVMTPRLEKTSAKHKQRDTLLQSNKTIFRLNDHNVRVPIYTRYTTSVAYRYKGVTKRSEIISPSDKINDTANNKFQIDYISVSGSDNTDTYEQRVLADGGTLERTPLLDEFLDTTDIGIVDELYIGSDSGTEVIKIVTEPCTKYEPYKVTFVNKFGALQDMWFSLKSTESLNTTGETYKANVMNFNTLTYATYKPQVAQYNKSGKESITLNTNYISEDYNEVIKQLMMSEQVWITKLTDTEEVLAVIPKTQNVTYKTSLNDRLVQYTVEFDYAFDKINTVR
jgi:hypothetical protein